VRGRKYQLRLPDQSLLFQISPQGEEKACSEIEFHDFRQI